MSKYLASVPVNDTQVRELHLRVNMVDLIPTEYMPVEQSFDTIVLSIRYSDPYSGRPRTKTVRIPSNGF